MSVVVLREGIINHGLARGAAPRGLLGRDVELEVLDHLLNLVAHVLHVLRCRLHCDCAHPIGNLWRFGGRECERMGGWSGSGCGCVQWALEEEEEGAGGGDFHSWVRGARVVVCG